MTTGTAPAPAAARSAPLPPAPATASAAESGGRGARRGLKRVIQGAACRLGLHHLARRRNRGRLLVCCYHGVRAPESSRRHWLLVPSDRLAEQLAYLKRHYRCVPLDQAVAELQAGTLREPTACVTFDDGYRSVRELALPLLVALDVPATVYLITGLVGTDGRLWTTRLLLALEGAGAATVDLRALGLGVRPLGDAESRRALAAQACEALKRLPRAEREAILDDLHAQLGGARADDAGAFAIMSWTDARTMAASGLVTFGGHTVHHDVLRGSEDERVFAEVHDSVETVSARLDAVSRTFAYPNGRAEDFDARAVVAVRASGGVAAVTTMEGLNGPDTDPYALRRVSIGADTTLDDFRLRASGLWPTA